MKKLFVLLMVFFVLQQVMALNLNVEKTSSNEIMIAGANKPTTFNLTITNLGDDDYMEFYNLLGFQMFPVGTIPISKGETKKIQLEILPIGKMTARGLYTFSYFIKGKDSSTIKQNLAFNIIDLKDAFSIGANEFNPESNSIKVFLKNKENMTFKNIDAKFSSIFFSFEKRFSLRPLEKKEFDVKLDQEDFKKLKAGFYTLNAEIEYARTSASVDGVIKFSEKNNVKTVERDSGFLIRTKSITKQNKGNIDADMSVFVVKGLFSSLFTTFSPKPDFVDSRGWSRSYVWERQLKPGEFLEIKVKTNWLWPFIIVILVFLVSYFLIKYLETDLVLKKRITFMHAKGGEFALKVSILVESKRFIEGVNIVDRLPPIVKIHERFGAEKPTRIDSKKRKIEWNFEKLESGETRILSYIIYSKIGFLGKFALPQATAIYEKNGKIKEISSNRAYFISEKKEKDTE